MATTDPSDRALRRRGTLRELLAEDPEPRNRKVVRELYKALARSDKETIARLIITSEDQDLEWWFHGPPNCQYMMRMLTGESRQLEFKFRPRSIAGIADFVIVEGWSKGTKSAYWVHVWTVKQGIITQLREYFDTWITVICRVSSDGNCDHKDETSRLWRSEPKEGFNRSLPDVLLTI